MRRDLPMRIELSCSAGAVAMLALAMGLWSATSSVQADDVTRRSAILAPTRDFSAAERWESLSGGSATNRKRFDREAFSQPSSNLGFEQRATFFIGNGLFRRLWVSAPGSATRADGLGPVFNARACQRCHIKDGRGHPPASPEDSAISMLVRLGRPPHSDKERALLATGRVTTLPDPRYGGQIQDLAVAGVPSEARVRISYTERLVPLHGERPVALRSPRLNLANPAHGPLDEHVGTSVRIAPPMVGLGLLEAIPDDDIRARADPLDSDGDGISGRARSVHDPVSRSPALGRFGWRAGTPSLRAQNAAALAGDMGLSTTLHPDHAGDCTPAQTVCRAAPHGAGPGETEVDDEMLSLITFYSAHLAVPARRNPGRRDVLAGKRVFHAIGCIACHTPKHATRRDWPDPALAGQLIWPYTDLLLHDMGEGLADTLDEHDASRFEWRTPPLWGLGLTRAVNGHTQLLHDGRARNITEAILWHGGESAPARTRFQALSPIERARLLAFLESL